MRISDWSSDVCSSDLMAALLGAHIIKVKLPSAHIEQKDAKKAYEGTDWAKQSDRVRHVVQSCFNGRRIVVFSGGAAKGRSEERRVGKEWVSTGTSRLSPYP